MLFYRLDTTGKSYDFGGFRRAVHDARRHECRSLTVCLDGIGYLDSSVVRELILALRALRDIGGNVRLHVNDARLLEELRSTGLDRVFTIEGRFAAKS